MRELAFDIVYGTMESGKHSDDLFLHAVEEKEDAMEGKKDLTVGHPGLTRQEKSFVRRLSYGVIERVPELDAVLNHVSKTPVNKMKPVIRTILRMGVYEILYMDSVPEPATCNEMVELAKKKKFHNLSGFVNGVLRNVARTGRDSLRDELLAGMKTDLERLSYLYSVPEELTQMLIGAYGKKSTEKILASFYKESPVTIRVQTMNAAAEEVKDELMAAGILVKPCPYVEDAFQIESFDRIESLPGFQEGHFTIQDVSSMLPVMVAGIESGDLVMDVCSSPGGKALQAADRIMGRGLVSARDVSEKKIEKIRENIKRLRAEKNVEVKVWDGTVPDEEWHEKADVVLVDVPCSGIGVIGRKPEIKYDAMKNAPALRELQRCIVMGAEKALRPGGTMIYSTCTVNPAENEENAEWIVKNLPLDPVSLDEELPDGLKNKMTRRGMLQILPGIQEGDGFFVAKFVKR